MPKTRTSSTAAPDTTWLGHGRHLGHAPEQDVRRNLIALKAAGVIDDFLDLAPSDASAAGVGDPSAVSGSRESAGTHGSSARRRFEARWRVDGDVTVRAQLTCYDSPGRQRDGEAVAWTLAAEAERTWDQRWPSPATMFWPDNDGVAWDHDAVPGPRLRTVNRLPGDDKEMRRLLKDCTRLSWNVHVVVHEAMTPDARGRRPLTPFLPPGLRHRVVEHRAAPEQFQIVNWAMKDVHVQVPRGGAVVLPTASVSREYDAEQFAVRTVFLDGSEPTELIERITAFAGLPRSLTADAEQALGSLRRHWHLLTVEEELAHARELVAKYAEALDAMTRSRDLYREAAELAQAALAEVTGSDSLPHPAASDATVAKPAGSSRSVLTKALGRFKDTSRQHPQK
ncbi:hypothetical protein [Streptomyces peucetius]|uniref:PE-PGRS family protein n=1 Tax=Streptomyces peucetius TaxID=1950 RepID=A0ABY6I2G9_STRPE|nr:hypothetical protein [Streptomyces peucetius]UYQ60202.1 hypothetical protein OGH68_01055 [Streptomyces peucetius]